MRELVTKGATGLALILTTDDARKTYEELKAKGVEITQEPIEQDCGIDFGLRDPFGNHLRVTPAAGGQRIVSCFHAVSTSAPLEGRVRRARRRSGGSPPSRGSRRA